MGTDIVNITESKVMQDRIQFEVDAHTVSPAAVTDLAGCLTDLIRSEHCQHLYDQEFTPYAAIIEVLDPLKFKVRLQRVLPSLLWFCCDHLQYSFVAYHANSTLVTVYVVLSSAHHLSACVSTRMTTNRSLDAYRLDCMLSPKSPPTLQYDQQFDALQIQVIYQLAFNAVKHSRVCEARTYVTHCIGLWQTAWKLSHTRSRTPVMQIKPTSETGEPLVVEAAAEGMPSMQP
jgi:hypothetical protein